jgi:hypothetical protein
MINVAAVTGERWGVIPAMTYARKSRNPPKNPIRVDEFRRWGVDLLSVINF